MSFPASATDFRCSSVIVSRVSTIEWLNLNSEIEESSSSPSSKILMFLSQSNGTEQYNSGTIGLFSLRKTANSSRTKDDDEDENEFKLRNLG